MKMRPFRGFERIRDERGSVAAFMAVGIAVFIGIAAIAVDLGHMMNTRTESQRVADFAALAAAAAFMQSPGPNVVTVAEANAQYLASQSTVNDVAVALQLGGVDVQVDVPNERVRVWVRNTTARGNAIPTIFARMLGINTVDIQTTAVAEATQASDVNCMLPIVVPDAYDEYTSGLPVDNPNAWDPNTDDYYEAWNPNGSNQSTYTGYSDLDAGTPIILKPSASPGYTNEDWYYVWRLGDNKGGNDYRDAVKICADPTITYSIGDSIQKEPGNMIGPTVQGFADLIAQDPFAYWNAGLGCVSRPGAPTPCVASVRQRMAPMFDPTEDVQSGAHWFHITNFSSVFVEAVVGFDVHAVWAGYGGVTPAGGGSGSAGPLFKVLRLIE
jgi:Flp pilus assembly protein TadG